MSDIPNNRVCEICQRPFVCYSGAADCLGWHNWFLCSPECCARRRQELGIEPKPESDEE